MGSGRWLSLEVDSPEVVEDIKTLLMLKRPLKNRDRHSLSLFFMV